MRTIDDIFQDRTCYKFQNKHVDPKILQDMYNLMSLGPTSGNSFPIRMVFVQSKLAKEQLVKCLMEGNIEKVRSAPITVLFAYDPKFYKQMDITNPVAPELKNFFSSSEAIAIDTATRNSTLQAAYFMMIARGYGLDCGPMSGFDAKAIEKEFFSESGFKINFICNIGYKDGENPYERLPRVNFLDCCSLV